MANRIVVDFNALDRIVRNLTAAGTDIEAAMSILGGANLTKAGGAYSRLNGADILFQSISGSVSASNVAQVVVNYRSAAKRLSDRSRNLSLAVKQASDNFRIVEGGVGRGLSSGQKPPAATDSVESQRKSERALSWGKEAGTVSAVEYALLSQYCSDSSGNKRGEKEITDEFITKLKDFPDGHPLKTLYYNLYEKEPPDTSFGTVEGHKMGTFSDMEAVVIKLTDGHAIVIFAGTDASNGPHDFIADAGLTASACGMPAQQMVTDLLFESEFEAANHLIQELEREGFHHISATGHSLGGHLAADVTLHNPCVDECFTFDPPGRGDAAMQYLFNSEQVGKITNILANGSIVHVPGTQVGNNVRIDVEFNTDAVVPNHAIGKIIDSLGGMDRVRNDWR